MRFAFVAWRKLVRDKLVTAINVAGLAIGMAAALIIGLYLIQESRYDRFHTGYEKMYRISVRTSEKGVVTGDSHIFTPPIGPAMADEIPGVEDYARLSEKQTAYLSVGENAFKVSDICYADSSFFAFFTFPLIDRIETSAPECPISAQKLFETGQRF